MWLNHKASIEQTAIYSLVYNNAKQRINHQDFQMLQYMYAVDSLCYVF